MIKISYPNLKREQPEDIEFLTAQIMWYSILPMIIAYVSTQTNPLIMLFALPMMILRLQRDSE